MRFSKPQLLVIVRSRALTMTTNGWEGVEVERQNICIIARLLVTIELWPQISITNHNPHSRGSTMMRTWSSILSFSRQCPTYSWDWWTNAPSNSITHSPHLCVGFLRLPYASNLSSERTCGPAALPPFLPYEVIVPGVSEDLIFWLCCWFLDTPGQEKIST